MDIFNRCRPPLDEPQYDCCRRNCDSEFDLAPFLFYAVDAATGTGIAGAVFHLFCNGESIGTATSNADGAVWFPPMDPGHYTLIQTAAPADYQSVQNSYEVEVDRAGNIFIEGTPVAAFKASNTKAPAYNTMTLIKFNTSNGRRLPGATFELRSGDRIVATAISNQAGELIFDQLLPGTYALVETKAPVGFVPDLTVREVVVSENGAVTVGGFPPAYASIGNEPV